MSVAVIGHSGFVGGSICKQAPVTECYNSKNIEDIRGRSFDTLICAGAPGAKWKANSDALADLESIGRLIASLREARAARLVLISTVDVYREPSQVDEDSLIDAGLLEPYGRHRYHLEVSVRAMFPKALIVRLPGLFGPGLKKNFIYDLMNGNALDLTHHESRFQFYDMANLWADISEAMTARLRLVNFATEPVTAGDVAQQCFGLEFRNVTGKAPVRYDMRTRLAAAFGRTGPYLYSAAYTFAHVRDLVRSSQQWGAA